MQDFTRQVSVQSKQLLGEYTLNCLYNIKFVMKLGIMIGKRRTD